MCVFQFFVIRARMKAKREAGLLLSSSAPSKSCRTSSKSKRHKDEEAVIALREKWREYKNRERSKWTAEKWQQHREKNKQAYHTRKAQIQRKVQKYCLCVFLKCQVTTDLFARMIWVYFVCLNFSISNIL